uniref:B box-type domain-containing protein n=1 Tax=Acrobeloides nanus TaxID=290746 RepID=A0A914BXU5_9BILA
MHSPHMCLKCEDYDVCRYCEKLGKHEAHILCWMQLGNNLEEIGSILDHQVYLNGHEEKNDECDKNTAKCTKCKKVVKGVRYKCIQSVSDLCAECYQKSEDMYIEIFYPLPNEAVESLIQTAKKIYEENNNHLKYQSETWVWTCDQCKVVVSNLTRFYCLECRFDTCAECRKKHSIHAMARIAPSSSNCLIM